MIKKIYIFTIIILVTSNLFGDDNGLTNYKNQKYAESKAYYEQLLAQDQENTAAILGLGANQYQLGDVQNAAKSFEEALKSEDASIQERAFYNLGNSIYSQQRPKESLAFYRKALELNPNDDDAKFNYELAKYLSDQQQQDQEQDQQQDQNQQNDQNNQNDQNDQNDDQQDTDKDEPDKQEDKDSDSSEDEQRDSPKTQKQINAEAILDALKDEEQIHQKVKMAQQSGRKHEKDW